MLGWKGERRTKNRLTGSGFAKSRSRGVEFCRRPGGEGIGCFQDFERPDDSGWLSDVCSSVAYITSGACNGDFPVNSPPRYEKFDRGRMRSRVPTGRRPQAPIDKFKADRDRQLTR